MTTVNTQRSKTYDLVIYALFIALTYVATWLINIRLPFMGNGGLIHLGNVPLLVAGMLYGKKAGAIAGAFGMGLFDLMSGWTMWAPFTFVIVGTMGFVIGLIEEKRPFKANLANDVLAVIAAIIIKIAGYYIAEVILFGNFITPLGSIPGNIIQVGVAGIIVIVFIPALRKFVK